MVLFTPLMRLNAPLVSPMTCIASLNRYAYGYAVLASVEAPMFGDAAGKTRRAIPDPPDTAKLVACEACAPLR